MTRAHSRTASLSVLALVLVAVVAACGGHTKTNGPERDDAVLFLQCEVPDATVWVNGRFVARIMDLGGGLALSPGRHRLEVRHDRFHDHYIIVQLTAKQRRKLTIDLAERLP